MLGEYPTAREQVQDGSGHLLPADSRSQRTATMIQKKFVAGLGGGLSLRGFHTPALARTPNGVARLSLALVGPAGGLRRLLR